MKGKFTNAEKAQELKRELGMRRHVYPRKVADGKMQQTACDRLIALAEEMQADYEALAAQDTPDLFSPPPARSIRQSMDDNRRDADLLAQSRNPPPSRTYDRDGNVERVTYTNTLTPGPRDPTFNLTPGINIDRQGQRFETCKSCGESLLVGQVKDVSTGTLNTRRWDAAPVEHDGKRFYRKHRCG